MHSMMKCDTQEQSEIVRLLERTFYEVVEGGRAGSPERLSALREEILNISDYDIGPSVRRSMGGLDGFLASYQ